MKQIKYHEKSKKKKTKMNIAFTPKFKISHNFINSFLRNMPNFAPKSPTPSPNVHYVALQKKYIGSCCRHFNGSMLYKT